MQDPGYKAMYFVAPFHCFCILGGVIAYLRYENSC